MNLIEQLGGYEKAKAFLNATSFTIDELIMMQRSGLRTQHVEKALLEYRRQHNIFEVGDDVVCDNFDETIKVINLYEGRLVIDTGIKTTPDSENTMVMALPAEMFRHATPEEIKAGKRLEVKSEN